MSGLRGANIHITGIIQGVGFRPFIFGLASRLGLTGWVRNTSAGVDIEVDGSPANLDAFLAAIKSELPPLARIDTIEVTFGVPRGFAGFEIVHSEALPGAFQPISPDMSICPDCLGELFDPQDRHYLYPFINCTNCGPRFTIITDIPYDRPNTTMDPFEMCPDCAREYADPLDRRFHAQPAACPRCGPVVWLETNDGKLLARGQSAISTVQSWLEEGRIVAIKGLGGFHLACDASNAGAVAELRRRKLRVDKPFALMMADTGVVEQHCLINAAERALLESRSRPIVLLRRRSESGVAAEVAPFQDTLGVMLPYTPLHYLLFSEGKASSMAFRPWVLVMTSGNISDEPIATDNEDARHRLSSLADAFLLHNREIRTRCDDSVVRVFATPENGQLEASNPPSTSSQPHSIYPLRRSRGYAPDPIRLPFDIPPILAVGPELKNTFCLVRERYAFLSHHIGDMENYETLRSFKDGVNHFERLFRIRPEAIAYDLHPDYLATRYALERGAHENLHLVGVQHHHAHIAACMADNGLSGDHPVIGVSFDGTGYGQDGAIWGGEFLVADYSGFRRPFHLAYFPLPGGDAAIRHPARTALALLWSLGLEWDERLAPVAGMAGEERGNLQTILERKINTIQTSSMGRLFDAAAALVGGRQRVNYEAQAAIEFEAALDPEETGAYRFELAPGATQGNPPEIEVSPGPAVRSLLEDVLGGVSIPVISARFHTGLADMVRLVCSEVRRSTGITEVALSGGVWQNIALLGRTVIRLQEDGFQVYLHRQVPTNDGGLSLGQALVGAGKLHSGATGE